MANPGGGNKAFTSVSASLAVAERIEQKRNTIAAAAQAAVQSSSLVKAHGSAAWIAEIAQAQMQIATTPDAGVASTKAADWLVTNAGLGERQAVEAGGAVSLGGVADLVAELAAFASSVAGLVAAAGGAAADSTQSMHLTNIISNDEGAQKEGEGEEGGGG